MKKTLTMLFVGLLGYTYVAGQNLTSFNYFGGDTLKGFDVDACYKEAIRLHYTGRDMPLYLHQQEKKFVIAKYHLKTVIGEPESHSWVNVPNVLTSTCNNVDFENGDFTGWVGAKGYNNNSTAALRTTANGIFTVGSGLNSNVSSCAYHTLLSAAGGNDPYSGLPVVDPSGGTYAARLGGDWMNICASAFPSESPCTSGKLSSTGTTAGYSGGELLKQTFIVTASNSMFTYKYSVVMDSIDHTSGEQPYFRVEVLDSANRTLPCLQYYVESINGVVPAGFVSSKKKDTNTDNDPQFGHTPNSVFYCPWTSNSMNLSAYIGHTVTVRFTAAGCTVGGHFCYAYVDASCGSVHISSTGGASCAGQNDTLNAPPIAGGGSYQWSTLPSGTAGIIGSTTGQTIVVNAPGTYQVKVTLPGGCSYTIDTTLVFPGAPAVQATPTSTSCNGANDGTATATVSSGTGPFTYSWSPGTIAGQGTATATGLAAGNYTVQVTNSGGCSSLATVTITQPSALAVSNSTTAVACNGGNNGSATTTVTGGTGTLTYSWSPSGGTNATASGLSAGNYTCTVTDAKGCSKTSIANVSQPVVLAASTTPTPATCNGSANGSAIASVTGGTTVYSYSWSPIGGSSATANSLPAGTYTCTVTDANNCTTNTTATITEPSAIALVTSSTPTPCAGATGSASVTASGGNGAYTYSWSPVSNSTSTLSGVTVGTYTVNVTDGNGCVKTTTVPVSNTGGPSGSLSTTTDVTCFGGTNGAATVTGSGGTGTLTYSWSPAGGSGTGATTATGLPAGTYNVTITDGANCATIVPLTLNQPTQVTATTAVTNSSCNAGSDGKIVLNASGGSPTYSYSWSPAAGGSPTLIGLAAGNYTCVVTDSKGCPQTFTATVGQPAALVATNGTNPVSCNGGNNGSASVTASGGVVSYTYSWFPTGGNSATAAGLSAGNYTCTITDSKGCMTTSPVVVAQPAALTASNVNTPTSCNGGSDGTATITPNGGTSTYNYFWSPSGGSAATATGLAAGTYTCQVTDAHGCATFNVLTITQPTPLNASVSGTNVLCNGANNGTATANPNGGTPTYNYAWTPVGGSAATASNLAPGNYTCTISDSKGCLTTTSVTISQPGSALVAFIGAGSVPCNGGNTGTDTIGVSGGTPAYSYAWTPTGGNSFIGTGLSAGITYTCTVTDANGCKTTQTSVLTQPPAIAANPSSTPAICTAHNGTVLVNPSGGTAPFSYSWSPSSGAGSSLSGLASGTYTCTITDTNGCVKQVPVTVGTSNSGLHASFSLTPTSGQSPLTVAFSDHSGPNPSSWSWLFGDGANATSVNPSTTYTTPGTYTITETVTDAFGCTSDTTYVIDVKPPTSSLTVPNFFTPNGDGSNDGFYVTFTNLSAFEMKIYDRWGVLMSHLIDPNVHWDGRTIAGALATDGTYYYVVTAKGVDSKIYALNGFLQLMR